MERSIIGRARGAGGLVLGIALAGCQGGAGSADAIRTRVGELHLHQYASGGVASTLFVDPPTPIAMTELDSALPNVYTPELVDGPCRAIIYGSCAPHCAPPDPVDGGPVTVDGLAHALDLSFDTRSGGYLEVKTDDLGNAAGDVVVVRSPGAARIPGFEGTVQLPLPLNASSTLEAGLESGLEVTWTAADPGSLIFIELTVIPRIGGTAVIARCNLTDADARLQLPAAVLALMPPTPRQIDLEISRYRLVDVPVGDGRSVVLHGSDSLLFARDEP